METWSVNCKSLCFTTVMQFLSLQIPYLTPSLLRPIAGAINFCPLEFARQSDEDNIRIGIHEVIHALVREMFLAALGKLKAPHKN